MRELVQTVESPDEMYSLTLEYESLGVDFGMYWVVIQPQKGLFRCLKRNKVPICATGIDNALTVGRKAPQGYEVENIFLVPSPKWFRVVIDKLGYPNGMASPPVRFQKSQWYYYTGDPRD